MFSNMEIVNQNPSMKQNHDTKYQQVSANISQASQISIDGGNDIISIYPIFGTDTPQGNKCT